jgi:hypothetical protein
VQVFARQDEKPSQSSTSKKVGTDFTVCISPPLRCVVAKGQRRQQNATPDKQGKQPQMTSPTHTARSQGRSQLLPVEEIPLGYEKQLGRNTQAHPYEIEFFDPHDCGAGRLLLRFGCLGPERLPGFLPRKNGNIAPFAG